MIELTRLNGNRLVVNCDLIKYAEASPDTTLTLVTGDKLVVLESSEEVMYLALARRVQILQAVGAALSASEAAVAGMSAISAQIAAEATDIASPTAPRSKD